MIMRNIVLLFTSLLLIGCFGSPQRQNSSFIIKESEVQLDSVALTRYEYKMRGNSKDDIGDKIGAIEDYTRAIMVDPLYDTALYNRAIVKSDMGYKKEAITDYDKVLEMNPKYVKVYFARANAKSALGDRKGAMTDYNKAIELKPYFMDAYVNRSILKYENNDQEGALSDCKLAIKYCAPDADLYNNYGRFLYDMKRFKESAEAYGDGIKHFPEDYKLYYGRGLARNQSGDKKGACEDWRKSSALGCFEANALLPLCDECETDKKQ